MASTAKTNAETILRVGRDVFASETRALKSIGDALGDAFVETCQTILSCEGNVAVSGVGKPYFIAQKLSASMASTGTPSITLHPVDALHGDLGRIRSGDVVVTLSNSGASPEIVEFARAAKEIGVVSIAITCARQSPLAKLSDIVLDLGPIQEACPLGVAPSTSTTAMLAMGDAITLTVAEMRGFTLESFAKFHPGGSLGRRFQRVDSVMRPLGETAALRADQSVLDAVREITRARAGAAFVVDSAGDLVGVFTDGDLRRLLGQNADSLNDSLEKHMTHSPKFVVRSSSVEDAVNLLRQHQIDELPVVATAEAQIGSQTGADVHLNPIGESHSHSMRLVGHIDIQDLA